MARTIFIPGFGAVHEDGTREYFIPGLGVFHEDQAAATGVLNLVMAPYIPAQR